jgi:hypothetical protein
MSRKRIRYAVVGLGHIAQVAVLPAFAHAARNSELVSIVSSDRAKRRDLAKRYKLEQTFTYDDFDDCLRHGGNRDGRGWRRCRGVEPRPRCCSRRPRSTA